MKNNNVRLYNILLPLWLIVFLPTYFWLALIPLNYIIDRVVLRWSLGDMPDKGLFCRKHTWKICLAGFLSDLAGSLILLGVSIPFSDLSGRFYDIGHAIMFDPFSDFYRLADSISEHRGLRCLHLLPQQMDTGQGGTRAGAGEACGDQAGAHHRAVSVSVPVSSAL